MAFGHGRPYETEERKRRENIVVSRERIFARERERMIHQVSWIVILFYSLKKNNKIKLKIKMFQAENESDFEDWTEAMSVLIEKIERKNGFGQLNNNNNNNTGTMENNKEGRPSTQTQFEKKMVVLISVTDISVILVILVMKIMAV
jgi:hypothetical protein